MDLKPFNTLPSDLTFLKMLTSGLVALRLLTLYVMIGTLVRCIIYILKTKHDIMTSKLVVRGLSKFNIFIISLIAFLILVRCSFYTTIDSTTIYFVIDFE